LRIALAIVLAVLGAAATAAERQTFNYVCKTGSFSVTASVDGTGRWSKAEPVILQVADTPPQTLVADTDAPDAESFRNKDYEFYSLGAFTTLTHKSHGVTVKFYSGCRADSR